MIEDSTVFILGAGAHHPYGMPVGATLTRNILDLLPKKANLPGTHFHRMFALSYGQTIPTIDSFLADFRYKLERAGQPTIDSFLDTYAAKPKFPEIGKLAVARILLPLEFRHAFTNQTNANAHQGGNPSLDWMSYLFEKMFAKTTDTDHFLLSNKVSFVTFNYGYQFCRKSNYITAAFRASVMPHASAYMIVPPRKDDELDS